MASQLNVFIENRPGRIKAVTALLGDNDINIRALTIQDRGDFGMMKLLVNKPRQAQLLLADRGFACALKEIAAVLVDDRPGGLDSLMEILEENGVNIRDAYGFIVGTQKKAVFCLESSDPSVISSCVEECGFELLDEEELYAL